MRINRLREWVRHIRPACSGKCQIDFLSEPEPTLLVFWQWSAHVPFWQLSIVDCQPTDSPARRSFVFMLNWWVWHIISACRSKTTGLSSEPVRWSCDNCQRMSDFDSCQSNRTHRDGLHNWKASQVVQDLLWHLTSAYMRCVYGWAGVRYVITKFSRMDSLPNFVTHGSPLSALRAPQ